MEEKPEALSGGQGQVGHAPDAFEGDLLDLDVRPDGLVREALGKVVDEVAGEALPVAFDDDAVFVVGVTDLLRRNDAVAEDGHPAGVVDVDARAWNVPKLDASGLR